MINQGRLDEAVEVARKWTEAAPDDPDAWRYLGVAAVHAGLDEEAATALERGLELKPGDHVLLAERGFAHFHRGEFESAAQCYRQAAERGDDPIYRNGWGNSLMSLGQPAEAAEILAEAVRRHPNFLPAQFNLIQAYVQSGDAASGKRLADSVVAQAPRQYLARDAAVWPYLYDDETTPRQLASLHESMGQLLPRQRDPRSFSNNRDPERKLRVGFVSPDFREHSVHRFVSPVFEALTDQEVDLFAYSSSSNRDRGTERIASLSKKYVDVTTYSLEQFRAQVANDKIDVLFDLAGHTLLNRLADFSIRLAPVQFTWIGYPYSTGVPSIDYRIVDELTDPPGAWASEALVRLNPCFLCFGVPSDAPEPQDEADGPTFCSFNDLSKVSPTTIRLLAGCLEAVPGSKLILKARALAGPKTKSNLLVRFQEVGIEPGRIHLLGRTASYADHLSLYNQATVALDTYPYHGTTTTCEAIAMGLPVVCLVGQTHHARVGLSLVSAVGHPEWVCPDEATYIKTASKLAARRTADDRRSLRRELLASPLTDADGMAERLMAAVRAAWRHWCSLR